MGTSLNLIGDDIEIMRNYYDDALQMQGILVKYQYPILADVNEQGESVIDHYSIPDTAYIFFDGSPKLRTFKRLGWVVENSQDLPFLIHCSFHLPNLQKDCLFDIAGQYANLNSRKFRVTEITTDIQCPDHVVCSVVPVYEKPAVGRTQSQVSHTYNSSNHFLKSNKDYRGDYRSELKGD